MALLLFTLALFLILLSTGGFIVYLIKQQKPIFKWSFRILVVGFILHTLNLGQQYYTLGAVPVLSFKAALSFFSWTIIGAYLIFHIRFKLMVLGSFIVPFAAFLMINSSSIPGIAVTVKPGFRSLWLTVHVSTIFVGNGIFVMTFMAAVMYLILEYHIKKKRFGPFYARLPSLQTLDLINHYTLMYGFPFLTIGMISGSIYAQLALGRYWQWDPKEVWSLITWLLYAVLLHERLAAGWRGRRSALMSIVCFAFLIFTFIGASLWLSDYHSFQNLEGRN